MNPAVGSGMPVMQTSPPARPTISREMISLWPEPNVCTIPPAAMYSPRMGVSRAITGALRARASARRARDFW